MLGPCRPSIDQRGSLPHSFWSAAIHPRTKNAMPVPLASSNQPNDKESRRKKRFCVRAVITALVGTHFLRQLRSLTFSVSTPVTLSQVTKSSTPIDSADASCPFRNSPLYRSIYIYPTPDFSVNRTGVELSLLNSIYSPNAGKSNKGLLPPYPWLYWDNRTKSDGKGHYDVGSQMGQYTLELIVREMMLHPESCLQTRNPEKAKLFYVPYLPSMEFHQGRLFVADYSTSPYGQAIYDALEGNYQGWEDYFGFTSKYWQRRNGSDHILVWSEPLHGYSHPKMKRGNHHYIKTQRLLRPAIGIVVEVSTTFVQMYPKCAAKNVLVPYPNPDGKWLNGKYDQMAHQFRNDRSEKGGIEVVDRPVSYWYSSGNHGTCAKLRRIMQSDYKCTVSYNMLQSNDNLPSYSIGMRVSKICPCPGGDSPSAKRNFDSILAGCIPLVLSHDFVWPFSKEFDPEMDADPNDFSIRLPADGFGNHFYQDNCTVDNVAHGLPNTIDAIINNATEMKRLEIGVKKAGKLYSFYQQDKNIPDNPLREGILPDGGAAHALLAALAARVGGDRWTHCERELRELQELPEVKNFKC